MNSLPFIVPSSYPSISSDVRKNASSSLSISLFSFRRFPLSMINERRYPIIVIIIYFGCSRYIIKHCATGNLRFTLQRSNQFNFSNTRFVASSRSRHPASSSLYPVESRFQAIVRINTGRFSYRGVATSSSIGPRRPNRSMNTSHSFAKL